jgi:hypothetical protein
MSVHIEDNGRHVAKLDERINALREGFADSGATDDFDELLVIIHHPGYTTPVQLLFVNAVIDAVERNLVQTQLLRSTLLEGSRAVLAEAAELSVSR